MSRDPKDVFTVKTNRGKRHTVSKDNYIQSMVDDIKDTTPTKLWKTRLLSWVWASAKLKNFRPSKTGFLRPTIRTVGP